MHIKLSFAKMPKSEKGHNSTMKNLTEKGKEIRVSQFFINNAYMKFQNPSIPGSKAMRGLKSIDV